MDKHTVPSVYFLGIGGIGMSALARYFLSQGAEVAGYDKAPSALTDQLVKEGMKIHFIEDPSMIPDRVDQVIWTPAVPKEHREYRYFLEKGIRVKKRAEVLGEIASAFPTIAVAGTHGKTTTTTMIAHLFRSAGRATMAFLGGISKNYHTNFIQSAEGKSEIARSEKRNFATSLTRHLTTCIIEADEFDRSFLFLTPDIAVITSMDADHLDIYSHQEQLKQSFGEFATRIRGNGSLILKEGVDPVGEIPGRIRVYRYSLNGNTGFRAGDIIVRDGLLHFDFITPDGRFPGFVLGIPGMFNLENAIAALAAGWLSGIPETDLRRGLKEFAGVVRRFDFRIRRDDFIYIDDYAHHPEELHACIQAVRMLYPGKRITGVFQPHLYSRTRDLAEDFVRVLAELDSLILLEIYPAREQPIKGVDSRMLLERVDLSDKKLCSKEEMLDLLEKNRPEVLLTLGAGDIDQMVKPITDLFGTPGKKPSAIDKKERKGDL